MARFATYAPRRNTGPAVAGFWNALGEAGTTIQATSEEPLLPVSNIADPGYAEPWHSIDGADQVLDWSYGGEERGHTCFSWHRVEMPAAGQLYLELWSGSQAGNGDLLYSADIVPLFQQSDPPHFGTTPLWPGPGDRLIEAPRDWVHLLWDQAGTGLRQIPHRSGRLRMVGGADHWGIGYGCVSDARVLPRFGWEWERSSRRVGDQEILADEQQVTWPESGMEREVADWLYRRLTDSWRLRQPFLWIPEPGSGTQDDAGLFTVNREIRMRPARRLTDGVAHWNLERLEILRWLGFWLEN